MALGPAEGEGAITSRVENVETELSHMTERTTCPLISHQPNNKPLNDLKYCTMFIQDCDSVQMALRDHLALLSASKS